MNESWKPIESMEASVDATVSTLSLVGSVALRPLDNATLIACFINAAVGTCCARPQGHRKF